MASPRWCALCNRNVVPKKDFNWLVFIFLCGVCYVPVYLAKKAKCPICQGESFSPARAQEINKQ